MIARQAGFAIGIAGLGAALGTVEAVEAFARPFALAAGFALLGVVVALVLMPRGPAGAGR